MALIQKSSNPALNDKIIQGLGVQDHTIAAEPMTVSGAVNKSFILLALAMVTAGFTWSQTLATGVINPLFVWGGGIGGFITAMITVFRPQSSGITAPLYAVLEGLFLGAISAMYASAYDGIVLQAVGLTFGTFLTLLLAYRSGWIQVTDKMRWGIVAATGGVFFLYLLSWIMSLFSVGIPVLHSSGWVGIGFSLLVVVVAALNLILDFDFIDRAAEARAPKYMEWYSAFGLMVTLVWLYLEFLRLLSKLRD
ncbi:Bax inhibitor-1/YccA family protein [Cryomorphaceae bacterium]|nr:Bax inhibitor-1/YccA family protein [Cryomorphaceae bacterium]